MAADTAPAEALRSAVTRLEVEAFATPSYYHRTLTGLGLERVDFDDRSDQLLTHYVRLTEETGQRAGELGHLISPAYLQGLLQNLPLWVEACRTALMSWGIFHDRRL
ncbi:hypothetical protein [Streptomyces vinaceus]|uniref:hypothetical protein n=1 Tax=Streptomyces vinaceus TaxID=1960 RepID=UPI0038273970